MARAAFHEVIELATTGVPTDALVLVQNLDHTPASIYADAVVASPLTQPIAIASDGSVDFWIEIGTYLLLVMPSPTSTQFNPQTVRIDVSTNSNIITARTQYVVGVRYTGDAPDRPNIGGAFVIWNGPTDPGNKALDGDLGVGWTP